jgi:hypothetical protein
MFEPLSSIAFFGSAALYVATCRNTAVSDEAGMIRQAAQDIEERLETSDVLFREKYDSLSEIIQMYADCSEDGWDGESARALSGDSVDRAIDFIKAMPANSPMPEVSADPEGCIALDWRVSPHRIFSLSIGQTQRLPFAWRDGTAKGRGVEPFDGQTTPERILFEIQRIMDYAAAPVRSAK